jgi:hypothetical protein
MAAASHAPPRGAIRASAPGGIRAGSRAAREFILFFFFLTLFFLRMV